MRDNGLVCRERHKIMVGPLEIGKTLGTCSLSPEKGAFTCPDFCTTRCKRRRLGEEENIPFPVSRKDDYDVVRWMAGTYPD